MNFKQGGILIVLFLVLAGIAYFAIKPMETNADYGNTETSDAEFIRTTPSSNNSAAVPPVTTAATAPAYKFNYTPAKPQQGTLFGVVEVGATGFNSFVINMDAQKRWEIISKDFGESMVYEGLATTENIRAGLKKYLAAMLEKGVARNNMHFVISSGAQKSPNTKNIRDELRRMGFVVNTVNAVQEAAYAYKAVVPPAFTDRCFMVDIGTGNTKVSWDEGGRLKTLELHGAKYYVTEKPDKMVYFEINREMNSIPAARRQMCFILGGVPFTLARQHRKGEERYTVLKAPQFYKAEDKKMAAGLNIYKAMTDATQTATFVFDWDANFTIGFLLSLK